MKVKSLTPHTQPHHSDRKQLRRLILHYLQVHDVFIRTHIQKWIG